MLGKKKNNVTKTTQQVEVVPRFDNATDQFDNSFASEFINGPEVKRNDPTAEVPAELLNDAYNNQGCPIFYGFGGTIKPVPTPFNVVLEDVAKHNAMYSVIKDKIFENIKLNSRERNAHKMAVNDIEQNICSLVYSQFSTAYHNLLISYLVERFAEFTDMKDDFEYNNFSAIISSEVTNYRGMYGDIFRTLADQWLSLKLNTSIPVEQKSSIILFRVCQLRDEASINLASTLSSIIRNIMFGIAPNNYAYDNNVNYTYRSIRNKMMDVISKKAKNALTPESACYFMLNTFGAELVRDITNCIEILMFQALSTMDYLVTDDIAEALKECSYRYGRDYYD